MKHKQGETFVADDVYILGMLIFKFAYNQLEDSKSALNTSNAFIKSIFVVNQMLLKPSSIKSYIIIQT